MATSQQSQGELERRYAAALADYLGRSDEASLHRAYELGRQALGEGRSILEMVALHHQALATVLGQKRATEGNVEVVQKAGDFFAEAMSAFEMTNRAFGEANTALRRLNETLEKEAKRIAYALHDGAGQLLATVHMKLDDLSRGMPTVARERMQQVRQILDRLEGQLRDLAHELRPPILDDRGLVPALEHLGQGVSQRAGIRVTVDAFQGPRLPVSVETALYRAVQEALNNAAKHAHAKSVEIRLWKAPGSVCCSVRDDGVGFDLATLSAGAEKRGLGLTGIRERLDALGGRFEIHSAPGHGTDYRITVPIEG